MPHINIRRKRVVRFLRRTALERVLRWGLCHHWLLSKLFFLQIFHIVKLPILTIIIKLSSLSHTFFFWRIKPLIYQHLFKLLKVEATIIIFIMLSRWGSSRMKMGKSQGMSRQGLRTSLAWLSSSSSSSLPVVSSRTIIYINITTTILGKAKIRSKWNIKERTLDHTTAADWIRASQEIFVNTLPANQFAPLLFPHVAHVWWCVIKKQKVEPL